MNSYARTNKFVHATRPPDESGGRNRHSGRFQMSVIDIKRIKSLTSVEKF
jgi:hypothetical protein